MADVDLEALEAEARASAVEGESEESLQRRVSLELPLTVVVPAFVLSELKTAFQMGFLLFLPVPGHRPGGQPACCSPWACSCCRP